MLTSKTHCIKLFTVSQILNMRRTLVNGFDKRGECLDCIKQLNKPSYEREYRGHPYEAKLIESLLQGNPIDSLRFHKKEYFIQLLPKKKKGFYYDLLDGRQRCGALKRFSENKFTIKWANDDKYFRELTSELRARFLDYNFSVIILEGWSDKEARQHFLDVNNRIDMTNAEKLVAGKSVISMCLRSDASCKLFETLKERNATASGLVLPGKYEDALLRIISIACGWSSPTSKMCNITSSVEKITTIKQEEREYFDSILCVLNIILSQNIKKTLAFVLCDFVQLAYFIIKHPGFKYWEEFGICYDNHIIAARRAKRFEKFAYFNAYKKASKVFKSVKKHG